MTGLAEDAGVWPATESDTLHERASELDREAAQHEAAAKIARGEAAQLRAKAERLDDPRKGVQPVAPARVRVRNDGLMAAAGVAVEDLPTVFSARDLAASLGIADVGRSTRLLLALEEFGKVSRAGDDWKTNDPDEAHVRDFVTEHETFTLADVISACQLPEMDASHYVAKLQDRGVIEGAGGHYKRVPVPAGTPPHPTRRPPEKDPPAYTEAPKRGEAVRIVDHGKRATATSRHREKLRDQRHARMQEAREESAERARAKASKTRMRSKKNRK